MTFDEAIEKVEQLANFEVGKTTGNIRRDFKLELGDVRDILAELREEYAPTVEMTKEQARVLDEYREPDLYDGDYAFYVFFDETCVPRLNSMRDTSFYGNLTEAQLMQAWLHQDTIKVKGD